MFKFFTAGLSLLALVLLVANVTALETSRRNHVRSKRSIRDLYDMMNDTLTPPRQPIEFVGYGHYCGLAASPQQLLDAEAAAPPPPVDALDACCEQHIQCYSKTSAAPPPDTTTNSSTVSSSSTAALRTLLNSGKGGGPCYGYQSHLSMGVRYITPYRFKTVHDSATGALTDITCRAYDVGFFAQTGLPVTWTEECALSLCACDRDYTFCTIKHEASYNASHAYSRSLIRQGIHFLGDYGDMAFTNLRIGVKILNGLLDAEAKSGMGGGMGASSSSGSKTDDADAKDNIPEYENYDNADGKAQMTTGVGISSGTATANTTKVVVTAVNGNVTSATVAKTVGSTAAL